MHVIRHHATAPLCAVRRRLASEDGFTLVETLVAIVTGVIVTGALFAILEVSLHQTSRLTDRIQANQLGRTAMTRIVDELRSACISPNFTPIQEGSTSNELIFIDAFGTESVLGEKEPEAATKEPEKHIFKHKIKYEAATSRLIDEVFPATGGTWPNYTFSSTAKSVRIGENIGQVEEAKAKVNVFRYYRYATATASSGTTSLSALTEMTELPLKAANKVDTPAKAASVRVTFMAGPTSGNSALNRNVEMSNQVTLAFSIPSAETPIEAAPCE